MKRLSLLAGTALLIAAGAALAQPDGPHGPGMMLTEADANKDGKITAQEAQTMRAAHFDKMDANKDGFVDKDEMAKAWKEHGGRRHAMMMKEADANNDGKVSKAEFVASAEKRFDKMDTNKDGFLDHSDRKDGMGKDGARMGDGMGWMQKGGGMRGMMDGKGPMAELDANKDGKLSRAEFLAKNPMFERFDSNKDGVLDKSELDAIPGHGPEEGPPPTP